MKSGKIVVEPARVEALETWSSEYKCFELRCDIIDDQFTHEDQHKLYHRARLEVYFRRKRVSLQAQCRRQNGRKAPSGAGGLRRGFVVLNGSP